MASLPNVATNRLWENKPTKQSSGTPLNADEKVQYKPKMVTNGKCNLKHTSHHIQTLVD